MDTENLSDNIHIHRPSYNKTKQQRHYIHTQSPTHRCLSGWLRRQGQVQGRNERGRCPALTGGSAWLLPWQRPERRSLATGCGKIRCLVTGSAEEITQILIVFTESDTKISKKENILSSFVDINISARVNISTKWLLIMLYTRQWLPRFSK